MLERKDSEQPRPEEKTDSSAPSTTRIVMECLAYETLATGLTYELNNLPARVTPVTPPEYRNTNQQIVDEVTGIVTATAVESALTKGVTANHLGLLAGAAFAKYYSLKDADGWRKEFNLLQDVKEIGASTVVGVVAKVARGIMGGLRLPGVPQVDPENSGVIRESAHAVVNSGLGWLLTATLSAPTLLPTLAVGCFITVIANTVIGQPRGAERREFELEPQQEPASRTRGMGA